MTWDAHRSTAQTLGGDLATIRCQEQTTIVNGLLGTAGAWIGANDKNVEGTWQWVDGTLVMYENWNTNQPSNSGGVEDCAIRFGPSGLWNDAPCGTALPAVYESNTILPGLTCIEYVGK